MLCSGMRFARPLALVAGGMLLAACPPSDDGHEPDGGPRADGGLIPCAEPLALDPFDIGTRCAGDVLDIDMLFAAPFTLATELPAGLALVLDDAGRWRLRGTVPEVVDFVDASFALRVELVSDCIAQETVAVGFILDPCDGGDGTCGPFASAVPIGGFCLPDRIEPDVPFEVVTLANRCMSSTCTEVRPALCAVSVDPGGAFVGGEACVRAQDFGACSEDCSGGDGAPCAVPGLPAGEHVLASASGSLTVTVPYVLDPAEGVLCVYPTL
jgi:hypothetical protein